MAEIEASPARVAPFGPVTLPSPPPENSL
jgi:hypothetical protein